jgi:hypothetical protein
LTSDTSFWSIFCSFSDEPIPKTEIPKITNTNYHSDFLLDCPHKLLQFSTISYFLLLSFLWKFVVSALNGRWNSFGQFHVPSRTTLQRRYVFPLARETVRINKQNVQEFQKSGR